MTTIKIQLENSILESIKKNARSLNVSDEEFIKRILARYVLDPHIMESKEVKDGYVEVGPVNLNIANR